MRILQVNKFLWQFGGAERAMLELSAFLQECGHDIDFFGMQHDRNVISANSRYFVRNVDYTEGVFRYKARNILYSIQQTIYSRESYRKIAALLDQKTYDVCHVHMIEHQISPSVLVAMKLRGLPVVHTCHDHKLVCPESHLYTQPKNEICERCVDGGRYYHIMLRRCKRGSLGVSVLAGIAEYIHRAVGIYEKNVDIFHAPSHFLAARLRRGGIPKEKIRVLSNAVDVRRFHPSGARGDYVLYFGRLSVEKGIGTLLDAAAMLPRVPFVVVGAGPMKHDLQRRVDEEGLTSVRLIGYRAGEELKGIIDRARVVVLPSKCHENCPMVTLEAYAMGKPVIATRTGGTPENIDVGVTGFLVPPSDPSRMAEAIADLFYQPALCEEMGRNGRLKVEGIARQYAGGILSMYAEAGART